MNAFLGCLCPLIVTFSPVSIPAEKWHQILIDSLVSIPKVYPGDMVFWHCDAIHAVDSQHQGTQDSAVFFVPAGPSSPANDAYVARQYQCFLEGTTPPDFPANDCERFFHNRGNPAHLTDLGRSLLTTETVTPE
eukprot:m.439649 g.439649  ORF g.439649 m.439649 type:complete len:134 (+) comp21453_c0_seq7:265-666(+)